MTPLAIITAVVAFALGFFLGRGKKSSFNNPDLARSAREEGKAAVQERIAKRKSRILEHAKQKGSITNDDVEDLFCISDATARNYLNDLEHEGKLTQHGETGRGVYYKPT